MAAKVVANAATALSTAITVSVKVFFLLLLTMLLMVKYIFWVITVIYARKKSPIL